MGIERACLGRSAVYLGRFLKNRNGSKVFAMQASLPIAFCRSLGGGVWRVAVAGCGRATHHCAKKMSLPGG